MKVLIDGVIFQLSIAGIAKVWISLLKRLSIKEGLTIYMLDRGNCPIIPEVQLLDFPSYTMTYTAADSLLVQHFCDKFQADVFITTFYTSAVTTPQVQMVYDMIPEMFGWDPSGRAWKERELALTYASYFACISTNTRDDLHRFYPGVDRSRSIVTHCGVDTEYFNLAAARELSVLRKKYGLYKQYYMFVGSRGENKGYKNARLFFEAVQINKSADFDIICIGGEPAVEVALRLNLPRQVEIKRLDLSDAELASAYSGALALVYPSLYAGFGMPVAEAMASGCPVITTHHGSLGEVASDAALIISGHDRYELLRALERVRMPEVRRDLIEAGVKQAAKFKWDDGVERFYELLVRADASSYDEREMEFHRCWRKLRTIQAEVDVGLD